MNSEFSLYKYSSSTNRSSETKLLYEKLESPLEVPEISSCQFIIVFVIKYSHFHKHTHSQKTLFNHLPHLLFGHNWVLL
jgi:hypothetical protein